MNARRMLGFRAVWQSAKNASNAAWNFGLLSCEPRMISARPRANSGSRLAPKSSSSSTRIVIISGVPRPNMIRQPLALARRSTSAQRDARLTSVRCIPLSRDTSGRDMLHLRRRMRDIRDAISIDLRADAGKGGAAMLDSVSPIA